MRPLALAVLACLALPAAAQQFKFNKSSVPEPEGKPSQDAEQAKTPPPPSKDADKPNDAPVFQGDFSQLTVVKKNGGAALYADSGAGMKSSPRHYYLSWTMEKGADPKKPLLIFMEPPTEEYPSLPSEYFLASEKVKVYPGSGGMQMLQIWKYPEKPKAKGLYAGVSGFDKDRKPQEAHPIIWWGLSKGQDLETITREERKKVYEELK
jgi:hypothetical protein